MTATPLGEGRYQKVRLDDLITDGRFNRPVRKHHVERLATKFSPAAFGVLELWKRDDGALVILDGQHRAELLRLLGYPTDVKVVPALVHEPLELDQAAELFVDLNFSKLVGAYDRFHALLTATHTRTCDIDRIVRSHGLRVAANHSDGSISAVTALEGVYGLGEPEGKVLGATLAALTGAWQDSSEAFKSPILRGVALYFHEHRDAQPADVADALARRTGAPITLMAKAKILRGSHRMNLDEAIALALEQIMKPPKARPKSA